MEEEDRQEAHELKCWFMAMDLTDFFIGQDDCADIASGKSSKESDLKWSRFRNGSFESW